jgi:hypothetical protein
MHDSLQKGSWITLKYRTLPFLESLSSRGGFLMTNLLFSFFFLFIYSNMTKKIGTWIYTEDKICRMSHGFPFP